MIAIVLGVAMVSGTFVLTDSIDKAFARSSPTSARDPTPSSPAMPRRAPNNGSTAPTLEASLLPKVRRLSDVAVAEGGLGGDAHLIGADGKAIVYGGTPNLGFSIANGASRFNPLSLVSGLAARRRGRDRPHDREKAHFAVGDEIGVQAEGPVVKFKISGLVKFGSGSASLGGATLAGFEVPPPSACSTSPTSSTRSTSAPSPTSRTRILSQIKTVLPANAEVRTGAQQAAEDAKDTDSLHLVPARLPADVRRHCALRRQLRDRELALDHHRAADARVRDPAHARRNPRQVRRSIFVEALVIGTVASVVGLFLGLLLAKGLFSFFNSIGFTLPNSGIVFGTRTVSSPCSSASSLRSSRALGRPCAPRACRRLPRYARARPCRRHASPGSARPAR